MKYEFFINFIFHPNVFSVRQKQNNNLAFPTLSKGTVPLDTDAKIWSSGQGCSSHLVISNAQEVC